MNEESITHPDDAANLALGILREPKTVPWVTPKDKTPAEIEREQRMTAEEYDDWRAAKDAKKAKEEEELERMREGVTGQSLHERFRELSIDRRRTEETPRQLAERHEQNK